MPVQADGGGSGPGDHPGVTIVALTGDVVTDTQLITSALSAKASFLFTYQAAGGMFAVFATKY